MKIPAMPVPKLVILSITTLGIYELYWFYKRWQFIKEKENLKVRPLLRAIFAPFFAYSLFNHIFKLAKERGQKNFPPPALLALVFFVAYYILGWMPDGYWVLSFSSVFPLIPVQQSINYYYDKEKSSQKLPMKFNTWELIIIGVGGVITLLALLGIFLPSEY